MYEQANSIGLDRRRALKVLSVTVFESPWTKTVVVADLTRQQEKVEV